eukprot:PhM_4_TR14103/c3_g1_i1/m.95349
MEGPYVPFASYPLPRPSYSSEGCRLPCCAPGVAPDQAYVCEGYGGYPWPPGGIYAPYSHLHQGSTSYGREYSDPPSYPYYTVAGYNDHVGSTATAGGGGMASMGYLFEMDGSSRRVPVDVDRMLPESGNHQLGSANKVDATEPIYSLPVRRDGGRGGGQGVSRDEVAVDERAAHNMEFRSAEQGDEACTGQRLFDAQHKARGGNDAAASGRRGAHPDRDGLAPGEACIATVDASVRGGQLGNRACPGDAEGDGPPGVTLSDFLPASKYFLQHIKRSSRVATREEVQTLPLHVKPVGIMDVDTVKKWMRTEVRTRFEAVWQMVCGDNGASPDVYFSKRLETKDAEEAERCNIIERVSEQEASRNPTRGEALPFTTTEDRDDGKRRRLIHWTRADNEALVGYVPNVPLHHVSKYLSSVHQEVGGKRDLKCGFYQISLPLDARAKFRFKDTSGTLWQLTRAPMGHTCVPEIMHTLTSTIAGLDDYCDPQHAHPWVHCDVFLDGLRSAGSSSSVERHLAYVDKRAERVNASWKASDSIQGHRYTFVGVAFDHSNARVSVGERCHAKIKAVTALRTLGDIESHVSRLMHASAILGISLPRFYRVLKFLRRRLSQMARGVCERSDVANLAPGVLRDLVAWTKLVTQNNPRTPPPRTSMPVMTLYTDASSSGWGAVLFTSEGIVYATGARWPVGFRYEVNAAETRAVALGLEAFAPHLLKGMTLDLRVDNTSAQAAVTRGISKSQGVSAELSRVLDSIRRAGIVVTVSYVRSRDNPADAWSRDTG